MKRPIIITGAPATGKTTLQSRVVENNPIYKRGLDYTTRAIRVGEVNGVTRFFISQEEFIKLFHKGFFIEPSLEYAEYNSAYYGTPRDLVYSFDPKISVISALGIASLLKHEFPQSIWVHLYANKDTLTARLEERGESEQSIIYRTDELNSDPGTFNQVDAADMNFDTRYIQTDEIIKYIIDFINTREQ